MRLAFHRAPFIQPQDSSSGCDWAKPPAPTEIRCYCAACHLRREAGWLRQSGPQQTTISTSRAAAVGTSYLPRDFAVNPAISVPHRHHDGDDKLQKIKSHWHLICAHKTTMPLQRRLNHCSDVLYSRRARTTASRAYSISHWRSFITDRNRNAGGALLYNDLKSKLT